MRTENKDCGETKLMWTERDRLSLMGPVLNPACCLTPACWSAIVDNVSRWPEKDIGLLSSFKLGIGGKHFWGLARELRPKLGRDEQECHALIFVPSRLGRWTHAPPPTLLNILAEEISEALLVNFGDGYSCYFAFVMGANVVVPENVRGIFWDYKGKPLMEEFVNGETDTASDLSVIYPLSTESRTGNNMFVTCMITYWPKKRPYSERAAAEMLVKSLILKKSFTVSFNISETSLTGTLKSVDTPNGPKMIVSGEFAENEKPSTSAIRLTPVDKHCDSQSTTEDSCNGRCVMFSWRTAWRKRNVRVNSRVLKKYARISEQLESLNFYACAGRKFVSSCSKLSAAQWSTCRQRDVNGLSSKRYKPYPLGVVYE
ncbi:hypothetical protein [Cacatuid alphaherpesvirus 2]|uniref:Uncharacterized protein n=1 Tax=Cacatuid alphaherpesvirus 2 TaxID=2604840 RepID=A0A5B9R3Z0_9ALPH|nr:hypothetical protein QKT46_gp15 [Cacatuid alphaherpesvirus 2]QEG54079.1 hypothetical protein [Cacatuid alphaherpesvirus 2]